MKTLNEKLQEFSNEITSEEALILSAYPTLSLLQLRTLIAVTSQIEGVSFVSIKNYSSDISGNTENANHIINVGASYANMIKKDANMYANFDINCVDVTRFNYNTIEYSSFGSLESFQKEVKNALPIALIELQAPKASKDMSATIRLNSMLSFNTNTHNLLISGMEVGEKKVVEEGTFKIVKSAPKTIAKKLIEKVVNSRTSALRTFKLDNMAAFKVVGNTIEIG